MDNATGLIFHCLTSLHPETCFFANHSTYNTHSSCTSLCPPLVPVIFADNARCQLAIALYGFSLAVLASNHVYVVTITYSHTQCGTLITIIIAKAMYKTIARPYIKTHGSVSCGPRSRRVTPVSILTRRKKTQFSHLRSSVLP